MVPRVREDTDAGRSEDPLTYTKVKHMRPLLITLLFFLQLAQRERPPEPQRPSIQSAIVASARRQLGKRYVWGAQDTAFDCSGLVQYVFAEQSITLPRTAKEQSRSGRAVSVDSLDKGDLLIFQKPTGGGLHVGIYIGSGRYINASSVAGSVIERPLRRAELILARRVLP